jgi:hypothetical protein
VGADVLALYDKTSPSVPVGQLVIDRDAGKAYINGAQFGGGGSIPDPLELSAAVFADYVAVGEDPATTGAMRLEADGFIKVKGVDETPGEYNLIGYKVANDGGDYIEVHIGDATGNALAEVVLDGWNTFSVYPIQDLGLGTVSKPWGAAHVGDLFINGNQARVTPAWEVETDFTLVQGSGTMVYIEDDAYYWAKDANGIVTVFFDIFLDVGTLGQAGEFITLELPSLPPPTIPIVAFGSIEAVVGGVGQFVFPNLSGSTPFSMAFDKSNVSGLLGTTETAVNGDSIRGGFTYRATP